MQDFETLCFQDRADWVRLLLAYAQAEDVVALAEAAMAKEVKTSAKLAAKAAALPAVSADVPEAIVPLVTSAPAPTPSESDSEESASGWVSRVSVLDGVDAAQLSTLHGRVIALGYLKFKLIDRQVGLRYRLTPAGKQMAQTRFETVEVVAA
jgi:hypothetical protein